MGKASKRFNNNDNRLLNVIYINAFGIIDKLDNILTTTKNPLLKLLHGEIIK